MDKDESGDVGAIAPLASAPKIVQLPPRKRLSASPSGVGGSEAEVDRELADEFSRPRLASSPMTVGVVGKADSVIEYLDPPPHVDTKAAQRKRRQLDSLIDSPTYKVASVHAMGNLIEHLPPRRRSRPLTGADVVPTSSSPEGSVPIPSPMDSAFSFRRPKPLPTPPPALPLPTPLGGDEEPPEDPTSTVRLDKGALKDSPRGRMALKPKVEGALPTKKAKKNAPTQAKASSSDTESNGEEEGGDLEIGDFQSRAADSEALSPLLPKKMRANSGGSPVRRRMNPAVRQRLRRKLESSERVRGMTYCVCRQPYDPSRPMLECGVCRDYFHAECVGLEPELQSALQPFVCPSCRSAAAQEGSTSSEEPARKQCRSRSCTHAAQTGNGGYCLECRLARFRRSKPRAVRATASHSSSSTESTSCPEEDGPSPGQNVRGKSRQLLTRTSKLPFIRPGDPPTKDSSIFKEKEKEKEKDLKDLKDLKEKDLKEKELKEKEFKEELNGGGGESEGIKTEWVEEGGGKEVPIQLASAPTLPLRPLATTRAGSAAPTSRMPGPLSPSPSQLLNQVLEINLKRRRPLDLAAKAKRLLKLPQRRPAKKPRASLASPLRRSSSSAATPVLPKEEDDDDDESTSSGKAEEDDSTVDILSMSVELPPASSAEPPNAHPGSMGLESPTVLERRLASLSALDREALDDYGRLFVQARAAERSLLQCIAQQRDALHSLRTHLEQNAAAEGEGAERVETDDGGAPRSLQMALPRRVSAHVLLEACNAPLGGQGGFCGAMLGLCEHSLGAAAVLRACCLWPLQGEPEARWAAADWPSPDRCCKAGARGCPLHAAWVRNVLRSQEAEIRRSADLSDRLIAEARALAARLDRRSARSG